MDEKKGGLWKPKLYDKYYGIVESVEDYNTGFIVCLQKDRRYYANFDNAKKFAENMYYWKCKGLTLNLYEVISGLKPMKFYFDIDAKDLSVISDILLENLLLSVETNWKLVCNQPLDWNQVYIYNSHSATAVKQDHDDQDHNQNNNRQDSKQHHSERSPDDDNKKSWHIIFNQLIVPNYQAAKHVAKVLTQTFLTPDEVEIKKKFVDLGVYTSTRQFRFVFCHKWLSPRVKMLEKSWKYGRFSGQYSNYISELPAGIVVDKAKMEFISIFLDSCMSYVQGRKSNAILPSEVVEVVRPKYIYNDDDFPEIDIPEGYSMYKLEGNKMMLKREFPSPCMVCDTIHEHQGAFLIWNSFRRKVFFHCYRAIENGLNPNHCVLTTITNYVDDEESQLLEQYGISVITEAQMSAIASTPSYSSTHPSTSSLTSSLPSSSTSSLPVQSQTCSPTKNVNGSGTGNSDDDIDSSDDDELVVKQITKNKDKGKKKEMIDVINVNKLNVYVEDQDPIFGDTRPCSELSYAKEYVTSINEQQQRQNSDDKVTTPEQIKLDRMAEKRSQADKHINKLDPGTQHQKLCDLASRDFKHTIPKKVKKEKENENEKEHGADR